MRLTFYGGARTVTGSCYLLEANGKKILIDCGMFQGAKEEKACNYLEFPFDPGKLNAVILTHAHIDHSGLIPKLVKEGFRNRIYCTGATADLCRVMLPDSGHIQETETNWKNRKRARSGMPEREPLYTVDDAVRSLDYFETVPYRCENGPVPGIKFVLRDAGHILGSAFAEVWCTEGGKTRKIIFSGDLGQTAQPIIQDPETADGADLLLMESTYGNRMHEGLAEKRRRLEELIVASVKSGGNLIIPAFAVGRTQDLLYEFKLLLKEKRIPPLPVYIDSPMAVSVTEIYRKHQECFDEETYRMIRRGEGPFDFPGLHFVRTSEESMLLNKITSGAVIISANGMCEAGRIKHHLKHNLWRPEARVLFVGYQAEGTLGRRLKDGEKSVKILGEDIAVKAQICSIEGFSAHADQKGILDWFGAFAKRPKHVFLVHGEQEGLTALADNIKAMGVNVSIPARHEQYGITEGAKAAAGRVQAVRQAAVAIDEIHGLFNAFEYRWGKLKGQLFQVFKDCAANKKLLKRQMADLTGKLAKIENTFGRVRAGKRNEK
ncbi:MAG: MBL fold metallo-hydrolase RNA specificity domain-containing protein [Bacillota bacterium]